MPSVAQTLQLALAKHQSGQLAEAERLYRDIVRYDPFHADALHLLGVAAHQQHRHRSAVDLMTRAIEARPSAVYYSNLGSAYRALGERDKAIKSLQNAVQIDDRLADAHYNLGTLLKESGASNDAIACLRRATELQPALAGAWNNLGILLHERGMQEEAIDCYRKAVSADPKLSHACNNLGTALCAAGRHEDAIHSYQRAVQIDPSYADALCNLGNAHREMDHLEEAEACYRRVKEIDPRHVAALVHLGLVYQERGELDAAIAWSSRAIEVDSQHVEAHINRSFVRRLKGEFREGFAEFEWRWQEENIAPRFRGPRWDGSSLAGKTILVYAEQGVGDEIMFASCIPDAMRAASHCVLECDKRLIPLFARSFPSASLIPRLTVASQESVDEQPDYDVCIAAGSLLQYLRPNLHAFPRLKNYLVADSSKVQLWRERFQSIGNGMKVGISWRGGKRSKAKRKRSTVADDWRAILAVPGVDFVNLQYGDCRDELAAFRQTAGVEVYDWDDADPLTDLDGFAAQIAALDLVISIDNSTVHMAGALGTPVWNMIPFSPDWRWQMDREDALWYSSMRLFRQSTRGDWDGVFANVARCLAEITKSA